MKNQAQEQQVFPSVFIIIINWNNEKDTLQCLEALLRMEYPAKQIVIIDNASTDGSLEEIRRWIEAFDKFKEITVIALKSNYGFAGGNNRGIQYAFDHGAQYILLINTDTIFSSQLLKDLMDKIQNIEKIGILGCQIRHFPEKDKIWFNGGKIDFIRGTFDSEKSGPTGLKETSFITGCLMLIPVDVLKVSGVFDERYFLDVEDVDLSDRIKQLGFRLIVDVNTVIYHRVGASQGHRLGKTFQYYFHRNRMLYFSDRLSGISKIAFMIFQFFCIIPVWLVIHVWMIRSDVLKAVFEGYRDFLTKKFGRWSKS